MKILHGPQNIGGMAGVLAKAQRQCGVDAHSYCLPTGTFQYPADQVIHATSELDRMWQLIRFFAKQAPRYDGFQFYFGTSYTGLELFDIALLKRLGKKIFFYFCGCDIRDSKLTIAKYQYSACSQCWPMLCSPNQKRALHVAERYADRVFVSTPDLLEFVPGAVLIPQPLDMEAFARLHEKIGKSTKERCEGDRDRVQVVHGPSNQAIKGTKYLVQAVRALQCQSVPIELVLVEGKSYSEAMHIASKADIAVDQLLIGAYGQFAVEMMALGKPVVCYIREELREHYPPALPIVSATPDDIAQVLKELVDQRAQWQQLGLMGMDYVQRNHHSLVVARRLLNHYQQRT